MGFGSKWFVAGVVRSRGFVIGWSHKAGNDSDNVLAMSNNVDNSSADEPADPDTRVVLPVGVDPWDMFTRLGDMKQRAGDGYRRALILFFVLYTFQEFLNAAQVSAVSVFGVDISDTGILVMLVPVLLSLVLLDQTHTQMRESVIVHSMTIVADKSFPTANKIFLETMTPATLSTGLRSLFISTHQEEKKVRGEGRWVLAGVGAVVLVTGLLLIVQGLLLIRATAIAVNQVPGWSVGDFIVVGFVILVTVFAITVKVWMHLVGVDLSGRNHILPYPIRPEKRSKAHDL